MIRFVFEKLKNTMRYIGIWFFLLLAIFVTLDHLFDEMLRKQKKQKGPLPFWK